MRKYLFLAVAALGFAACAEKGLEFGVKLTNTFPVDVAAGELPSEEMYMSGRSLYILTTEERDICSSACFLLLMK